MNIFNILLGIFTIGVVFGTIMYVFDYWKKSSQNKLNQEKVEK